MKPNVAGSTPIRQRFLTPRARTLDIERVAAAAPISRSRSRRLRFHFLLDVSAHCRLHGRTAGDGLRPERRLGLGRPRRPRNEIALPVGMPHDRPMLLNSASSCFEDPLWRPRRRIEQIQGAATTSDACSGPAVAERPGSSIRQGTKRASSRSTPACARSRRARARRRCRRRHARIGTRACCRRATTSAASRSPRASSPARRGHHRSGCTQMSKLPDWFGAVGDEAAVRRPHRLRLQAFVERHARERARARRRGGIG